jgi:hypothetical protein
VSVMVALLTTSPSMSRPRMVASQEHDDGAIHATGAQWMCDC